MRVRSAVLAVMGALGAAGCGQATIAATSPATGPASTSASAPAATQATASPTRAAAARPHRRPRPTRLLRTLTPRPPRVAWNPIPFGPQRRAQTVAYVRRHYGSFTRPTWRLVHPRVIVIHYTDASYPATSRTFATDVPDSELHELPATCAHFVIDTQGVIHQLVSLATICRHTVGLNWTAIGVEHVGYSDGQVLDNHRQISASLHLVSWLRCRFHIPIEDVIGHAESLSSPYHHEDVPSLRRQTHSDFLHPDALIYRRRLRALGPCSR